MATTYTYSISATFPTGLDIGQLNALIVASSITKTLNLVQTVGDTLNIVFASALSSPELTTLGTIISTYSYSPMVVTTSSITPLQTSSTASGSTAVQLTAANAAGGITISSGTSGVTMTSTGALVFGGAAASNLTTTSGNMKVNTTGGSLTLDGSSGINIGNDASSNSVNLCTAAAAKTVTIGNTTSTSSVIIDSGTGGITIGNNSNNTGVIQIGNSTSGKAVTIGNTNTTGSVKIRWGASGGFFTTHQEAHTALADSSATLTMDNNATTGLISGLLSGTPTATRTLTLPTATNVITAISGAVIGDCFDFSLINNGSQGNNYTLAMGTGGTMVGNATLLSVTQTVGLSTAATCGAASFRIRFTNVTSGSYAYTVYRLS